MQVMAFAFTKEQVRILEHNDRFYYDLPETHVLRLSYELVAQLDYLHAQKCERSLVPWSRKDQYQREWEKEEELAYEHIALMHSEVSENWLRLSVATYVRQHREG